MQGITLESYSIQERLEIAALFTDIREGYRELSAGHCGFGGFCIAIANRAGDMVDQMFPPIVTAAPAAQQNESADMAGAR